MQLKKSGTGTLTHWKQQKRDKISPPPKTNVTMEKQPFKFEDITVYSNKNKNMNENQHTTTN